MTAERQPAATPSVAIDQAAPWEDGLWQQICAEAREAAAQEPALASYFHTAVLSHNSLDSALVHNLASRLGGPVISALVIRRVFAEAMVADSGIGRNMRRDILAHYERDPACDRMLMPLLYFKGFHALQVHRVAHWLWCNQRHALALYWQNLGSEIFSVDIHPGARMGGGIMLDHATGIVIGETAVVEDDVSILHSVSLGGTGNQSGDRHPKVGRGVLIAAGAKILGNIEIGAGAKIGAGSLVLTSVEPHSTVVGVPAKAVGAPVDPSPEHILKQQINPDARA